MAHKTVVVCTHCGSDNVQLKAWVKPNKNNKFVDLVEGDELGWCGDCELHSVIDSVELKTNAKVIGFQVVGKEESPDEGNIHPDMKASFCVYNLSQARKMIGKYDYWRLLTIWSGDIEDATMMFKGNPRN
jgi:hypothetical protein